MGPPANTRCTGESRCSHRSPPTGRTRNAGSLCSGSPNAVPVSSLGCERVTHTERGRKRFHKHVLSVRYRCPAFGPDVVRGYRRGGATDGMEWLGGRIVEPVAAGRRRDHGRSAPENSTGERGGGGTATEGTGAAYAADLGRGWKISPSVHIEPGEEFVMADITGSGAIQHIWFTPTGDWRNQVLAHVLGRRPAAGSRVPARRLLRARLGQVRTHRLARRLRQPRQRVQLLLGDAVQRHGRASRSPTRASRQRTLYYQIDYTLCEVPDDAARFCAQFRRSTRCRRATSSRSSTASAGGVTTSARAARGASTTAAGGARAS